MSAKSTRFAARSGTLAASISHAATAPSGIGTGADRLAMLASAPVAAEPEEVASSTAPAPTTTPPATATKAAPTPKPAAKTKPLKVVVEAPVAPDSLSDLRARLCVKRASYPDTERVNLPLDPALVAELDRISTVAVLEWGLPPVHHSALAVAAIETVLSDPAVALERYNARGWSGTGRLLQTRVPKELKGSLDKLAWGTSNWPTELHRHTGPVIAATMAHLLAEM